MLADFNLHTGEEFSLFSLDEQACFDAEGVAYPAQKLTMPVLGDRGISNVVISASAYVEARAGRFMLVRPLPLKADMLR
jgi:thiamine pyrophosphokinase